MQSNYLASPPRSRPWRWLAAAALLVTLFALNEVAGAGGYLTRRDQTRQMNVLSHEIGQLQNENEELAGRVRNLRSSPSAIEQYAREQLHLARPGDLVVALPPPAPPAAVPAPQLH